MGKCTTAHWVELELCFKPANHANHAHDDRNGDNPSIPEAEVSAKDSSGVSPPSPLIL